MYLRKYQAEVIEFLIQHEEAIGQLYKAYAEKFPNKKDFWTAFCKEELDHASWLKRLRPKVEKGLFEFNEGRFELEIVKKSINNIKDKTRKAEGGRITYTEALSIALEIEDALLESKFCEVYKTDSEELNQLLRGLEDSYKEHRNRLKETIDTISPIS